jgi:hypothetical protein
MLFMFGLMGRSSFGGMSGRTSTYVAPLLFEELSIRKPMRATGSLPRV